MNARRATWLLILVASLLGGWLAAYSTSWGPVIYSDAAGYIAAARNFLSGRGLGVQEASGDFKLLTVHLPLYPLVLAWISKLGISVVDAARWLNVFVFGLTVLLSGVAIYSLTGSSIQALSGCAFLLASPLVLNVFTLAMSDALFVFLSLGGVFALLLYLQTERVWLLAGAGLLLGIASAARYIGMAYILAGAAGVLVFSRLPALRRILSAVSFGILSSLPLLAWLGWSTLQPQTEAPRELEAAAGFWGAITPARLALVDLFWGWLPFVENLPEVSYRMKLFTFIGAAAVFTVLLAWASWTAWRRWRREQGITNNGVISPMVKELTLRWSMLGTVALCLGAVMASVLISYAYTRPQLDLNDRTLLPLYLLGMLLFLMGCDFLAKCWAEQKWLSWLPAIGIGIFVLSATPRTIDMAANYHGDGAGYAGRRWQESEVMQALEKLPADIPVITNEPAAVLFRTGRPAYEIAEIWQAEPNTDYMRYGDEMDEPAQTLFREQDAALVLFSEIRWQLDHLYYERTPERVDALVEGLDVYGKYRDGGIYFYPGK